MGYEATKAGFTPADYLISPSDLAGWARNLRVRDAMGLAFMVITAAAVGWWLQDFGAGLFAAGLVLAMWWRVDSRWALGGALALLLLIPLMQFLYDRNWLYSGSALAGGLAVAVWYLLAIGVVRAVAELRAAPSSARVVAAAPVHAPSAVPARADITTPSDASRRVVKPSPPPARPRRQLTRPAPAADAAVPSWRRRLAAIEADTRAPSRSRNLDGVRGRHR